MVYLTSFVAIFSTAGAELPSKQLHGQWSHGHFTYSKGGGGGRGGGREGERKEAAGTWGRVGGGRVYRCPSDQPRQSRGELICEPIWGLRLGRPPSDAEGVTPPSARTPWLAGSKTGGAAEPQGLTMH